MTTTDTINIETVGEDIDLERVDAELKSLILATEGMIPGSRGFGLAGDFLTMPPHEVANMLAIELEEKVETYIPEITIASVEYDPEQVVDAVAKLTIHVERRDAV